MTDTRTAPQEDQVARCSVCAIPIAEHPDTDACAIADQTRLPDSRVDIAEPGLDRPKVVCISGSTRFAEEMNFEAEQETLMGRIVVRPEVIAYHAGDDPQLNKPAIKADLDELHLRKIDLADEVLVVMVDGYIGESTRREIDYAKQTDKPIRYADHRRPEHQP